MLVTLFSPKGGSGTSVTAALVARAAASSERSTVLVDLTGAQADVLGVDTPPAGLHDFCASPDAPPDALARLAVEVMPHLRLIGPGSSPPPGSDRAELAAALLVRAGEVVVVDAGSGRSEVAAAIARRADRRLLVVRPCYLGVRAALADGSSADGVVLVDEPGRALRAHDVADALGLPVVAEVRWDPGTARAVDAGILATRPHRRAHRRLEALVA